MIFRRRQYGLFGPTARPPFARMQKVLSQQDLATVHGVVLRVIASALKGPSARQAELFPCRYVDLA
ncbi:protein of unknown function [Bradyrhizobium vignae]|uniref:Uncharacterized protein n=1 Tax=Bradyrhizobium vignae TaxID=1549949 RepID=A0A2U3Q235_9BRAD|nr:protein of unknown function [Bradyrhizobium vignae]